MGPVFDKMTSRQRKTTHLLRTTTGVAGLCLVISSCATYEPAPKGYSQPTAKFADSVTSDGGECAAFFFVAAYDGHDIKNVLIATEQRNSGRGFAAMIIGEYSRPVPAQAASFHLVGRTHCAAPVVELAHTLYLIEGDVSLTPQVDGQYVVKGELSEDHSSLWVEDVATGKQLGNKLLVRGSTALNRATLFLLGPAAAKSKQPVEEIPPN
jgi:hypothetical protein